MTIVGVVCGAKKRGLPTQGSPRRHKYLETGVGISGFESDLRKRGREGFDHLYGKFRPDGSTRKRVIREDPIVELNERHLMENRKECETRENSEANSASAT